MTVQIDGVVVKPLTMHRDGRGYFMENIRVTDSFFDGFGQWSESLMYTGIIKAWHLHRYQVDYWRVPCGNIRAVLYDLRESSRTYKQVMEILMGQSYEPVILSIPPGVAHGCKVLQGPALLTYVTTNVYDPADEHRIDYDDTSIGYDWLSEVIK